MVFIPIDIFYAIFVDLSFLSHSYAVPMYFDDAVAVISFPP
jgi:hypothetical protein